MKDSQNLQKGGKKMRNGWKITSIVFICLFILLLALNIWAYISVVNEEVRINNCYYNTCENYPEAWYEGGLCTCYDYDAKGELIIIKTVYNK